MSHPVADIFRQAAAAFRDDPRRRGNCVQIEADAEVLVSGDLHGFRPALQKLISAASLGSHPNRRLILQEIVHGSPDATTGQDRSVELLLRAARLRLAHGPQVLMILGNHDVAQVTGNEITKDGRGACKAFDAGVTAAFGEEAPEVTQAIHEMLLALPLAAMCPNGVFVAHSVPSPNRMARAGVEILDRLCTIEDFRRGQPAYEWTWGRGQTPEQLEELAQDLGVSYFILGHAHAKGGFETLSPRGLTITTDHEHGYVVTFRANEPFGPDNLEVSLKPIMTLC